MNYTVGFEMNNGEIYVFLTNTSNDKRVFFEKVTDQVLTVAEDYHERFEELKEKFKTDSNG